MSDTLQERLLALIEYASKSTVYYANLYASLGSPNPFDFLKRVPPLTRNDLQRERVKLCSFSADSSSWKTVRTSGTMGEPVEVILDGRSKQVESSVLGDHFDRCLDSTAWRTQNLFHLALHAGARSYARSSPWDVHSRVIKWNLLQIWQATDASFAESLTHLDGQIVTTMPSVAQLICQRLALSQTNIRPLLLSLSGEQIEPELPRQVSSILKCPVTSFYIATETGVIGKACTNPGEYHVEERNVFLEIVDDENRPVQAGTEGDILVTPLENYAMPLLRYRIGDRGYWCTEPCNCKQATPRLRLTNSRRLSRLINDGMAVNVVRFSKLFASLDIERFRIYQEPSGSVRVQYAAKPHLESRINPIMESAVRSALGPNLDVRVHRFSNFEDARREDEGGSIGTQPQHLVFEPDGVGPDKLAAWLRGRLIGERDVAYATLTGSAIDPNSVTRFSDIDLVILSNADVCDTHWLTMAKDLRARIPRLSVNIDCLQNLSARAPLITCRLLSESIPVCGSLEPGALPWPSRAALRTEGQVWVQQTGAILWHQLTSPDVASEDVIRIAWFSAKCGLTGLRYRYLLDGMIETTSHAIIERALHDKRQLPWLDDFLEAFDVARERVPPPLARADILRSYLAGAWFCVRSICDFLSSQTT